MIMGYSPGLNQSLRRTRNCPRPYTKSTPRPSMLHENDVGAPPAGDAEMVQQFGKNRICVGVEDDERGVDGNLAAVEPHGGGVRVPSNIVVLVVQPHLVALPKEPCSRKTRNPAPDDGDLHTLVLTHACAHDRGLQRGWIAR